MRPAVECRSVPNPNPNSSQGSAVGTRITPMLGPGTSALVVSALTRDLHAIVAGLLDAAAATAGAADA